MYSLVSYSFVVFCLFLVRKMGDLALHSALDARLETKKNLPDAGHCIVVPKESIPSLVAFFRVSFLFVNGAKYLAGIQPPGNARFH